MTRLTAFNVILTPNKTVVIPRRRRRTTSNPDSARPYGAQQSVVVVPRERTLI